MSHLAAEMDPKQWLHMDEMEVNACITYFRFESSCFKFDLAC